MQPSLTKFLILTVTTIGFINVSQAQASINNANNPAPIQIDKGQISTTITGKLNPNQNEHWYHFNAMSWQYALVNITSLAATPETANVGVLYLPDGTQDGGKGGIVYQGCLAQTGNYKLRIARNLMATEGKTAGYKVEVIILPLYASESLCEYL